MSRRRSPAAASSRRVDGVVEIATRLRVRLAFITGLVEGALLEVPSYSVEQAEREIAVAEELRAEVAVVVEGALDFGLADIRGQALAALDAYSAQLRARSEALS